MVLIELWDLELLRQRDKLAWDRLYHSCVERTYRVLYHVTKAEQIVLEELNQTVWLAAIETVDRMDGTRGTPEDWILGIARFQGLMYLRRKYRNRVATVGSGAIFATPDDVDRDAEQRNERVGLLRACIESLPENWQYVLRQKYEHGLSVKEIAESNRCSVKSIESVLSRSRSRLREMTREIAEMERLK